MIVPLHHSADHTPLHGVNASEFSPARLLLEQRFSVSHTSHSTALYREFSMVLQCNTRPMLRSSLLLTFGIWLPSLFSASHTTALYREPSMLMQCNGRSMLRSSPHDARLWHTTSKFVLRKSHYITNYTVNSQCSCNATLAQCFGVLP